MCERARRGPGWRGVTAVVMAVVMAVALRAAWAGLNVLAGFCLAMGFILTGTVVAFVAYALLGARCATRPGMLRVTAGRRQPRLPRAVVREVEGRRVLPGRVIEPSRERTMGR